MKASRDMYHFYKKTAKGEKLKETEYCKINNEFNKLLMKKIQEGHTVTFPCGMGRLLIQGKKERLIVSPNGKMRGLAPDGNLPNFWQTPVPKQKQKDNWYILSMTEREDTDTGMNGKEGREPIKYFIHLNLSELIKEKPQSLFCPMFNLLLITNGQQPSIYFGVPHYL